MRKLFLLFFIVSSFILVRGQQQISQEDAKAIGANFLAKKSVHDNSYTQVNSEGSTLNLVYTGQYNGMTCFFVFNRLEGGYIIVSSDNRTKSPVLGYSLEGSLNFEYISQNAKLWLDSYAEQIATLQSSTEKSIRKVDALNRSVSPLLGDVSWGQNEPYNLLCPEVDGERCVTGCGATAMAQIMYFHKWPEKGQGEVSYMFGNQSIKADLSESVYEWDKMLPEYDINSPLDSQMAVAQLMRDCGYSVEMDYGPYGSVSAAHEGHYWIKYFDYDRSIRILPREFFDDEDWEDILRTELDNNRPVIYEGGGDQGSHIFVCDGYDEEGYFHFNFGWDGRENGYFLTSANLYPMGQYMICGIECDRTNGHVLDYLSSSSFVYDSLNDMFKMGHASICDVGEGMYESNQNAIIGLAIEDINSGEISYNDGTSYPLFNAPNIRNHEIRNNIYDLKDGEYTIRPVCRNINSEDDWVFCNFKKSCRQTYVSLSVVNGTYSYRNEGLESIKDGIVYIDGIFYLIDRDKKTATVTVPEDMKGSYQGHIIIPETISFEGQTYVIDCIGAGTFYGSEWMSVEIPKTVKRIGEEAFKGIYLLEDIVFPKDSELEVIEDYAFDCIHDWQKIELPKKLRSIGKYTFRSIDNCKYISIPESVTNIEEGAFMWSNWVRDIFVYWNEPISIDANVFIGTNLSLITLNVPEGTSELYDNSFPWSEFNIHDGNNWIEEYVELDHIRYCLRSPDMTAKVCGIDNSCDSEIILPEFITHNGQSYTLTEISVSAFRFNDTYIHKIMIPKSVCRLEDYAFWGQNKLRCVEFENDSELKIIGIGCFTECNDLESISLPMSLEYISSAAFQDCQNLNSIEFPESVVSIDQNTFVNCPSLRDVTVHWFRPLEIHIWAFGDCNCQNMRLHVPKGSKESYLQVAPWSMFGEIIEDVDFSFVPVTSITLSPNIWSGESGDVFRIQTEVLPENASDKLLRWSSSDESIAFVDNSGLVYVDGEGTCVITAEAMDGSGVSAECTISSTSGVENLFMSTDNWTIYDLNGNLINSADDLGQIRNLSPGLYIIRSGTEVRKLIIR